MPLVWLLYDVAVDVGEHKLAHFRAVGNDSALPCRVVVARSVIFAKQASVEDSVHVHILHRVDLRGRYVAKPSVYSPHINAFRHFLVSGSVFAVLVEIVVGVFVALRYLPCLVNLVVHLGLCAYGYKAK